jgi:ribosomal protein S12 methylthiotransferase
VIVGFPGETDDDFQELLALLEDVRFDYLGAFAYSPEDDTIAARMPAQVPDTLKRERLEMLLERQRLITQESLETRLGRVSSVLIDQRLNENAGASGRGNRLRGAIGRTTGQALEIDGVVHIEAGEGLEPGQFARVRLLDVLDNDLIGEVAHEP